MDVTPLIPADRQFINCYGPGIFRVSGTLYEGPLLVFPDRTQVWNATTIRGTDAPELRLRTLRRAGGRDPVARLRSQNGPSPSKLRRELRDAGIVVDVMETGAACRTYNVLLSEERRVAAALLPI